MVAKSREELINQLWYDEHFASLTSNRARLEYAVAKYLPLEHLHELVRKDIDGAKTKNGKSLTRAEQFKKEADLLAKGAEEEGKSRELFDRALVCYHKAILHTPKTEPHLLAKLYARKSALHSKKGDDPEAALYAISTAVEVLEKRTSQPPKAEYVVLRVTALKSCKRYGEAYQALEQLLQQEQKSSVVNTEELRSMLQTLKQLVLEQEIDQMRRVCTVVDMDSESLSKGASLQPYAAYQLSAKCSIKNSPVVGRHFIASDDIFAEEVLLEERPYSTVLSMEHAKKRCSYCFSKLGYKFFPCSECTEVLFCDQQCAQLALETSHRYECGLRSVIFAIGNLSSLHVSQMVAFVGGPIRAYDAQLWGKQTSFSIENFLAEPAQRGRPHLEKTAEEKWRAYTMSSRLVAHDEAHSFNENVWQTIAGLEMAALFNHLYRFRMERPSADFFLDLAAMLMVDIRRITFNVFGWQSWASEDATADLEHLAQAQCLVGSLVNHSCVPNCSWEFTDEGVIRFVAKRPIKAGTEVTISYGAYSTQSYEQRQKRLNNYYFACACPACFEDARRGSALRCLACSGPVPFESTVNKVPQLSGKCLLCFKLYPAMSAAVEKLKAARVALKALKSLSKVAGGRYRGGHLMLLKAVQAVRTLEALSFLSSDQVQQSLLCCSQVFENLGAGKFNATFSLEERIEFALFLARHLKQSTLQKSVTTLQFWFERLLELVAAFNDTSTQYNAYETDLWSAVFSLYEALKHAVEGVSKSSGGGNQQSISGGGSSSAAAASTLAKLKQGRLAALSQSLQQSITDYGPDRVLSLRQTLATTTTAATA